MRQGELWFFDPIIFHEAQSLCDETRIHFVIDVFSRESLCTYLARAKRVPLQTVYRSVTAMFRKYLPPRPSLQKSAE